MSVALIVLAAIAMMVENKIAKWFGVVLFSLVMIFGGV